MRNLFALICMGLLLFGCSGTDPQQEIADLIAANKIVEAKTKYEALVESSDNPVIERQFINFLYEHRHYRDFLTRAEGFMKRYPDDTEIKTMIFDYYGMLATDAEKRGDYADAMAYIVSKLLSPDYRDYRKWESKQTSLFNKWYESAKAKGDTNAQRDVLTRMIALGFENMAQSLDPELYESLKEEGDKVSAESGEHKSGDQ